MRHAETPRAARLSTGEYRRAKSRRRCPFLLSVSEHRFRLNRCPLRHNGQCQIIASAAFVVGSEVSAVAGESGSIGKVTEPSENRVGRGVGNNGENCAGCERGSTVIDKCKRHVAVNSYAEGGNFRRFGRGTVQRAFISRERPKR